MYGGGDYWLTRYVFQRALGVVFLVAFLCALNQFRPLLGERGLLPAPEFMRAVPFRASPSLFYLAPKDWAFTAAAWLGIALSCFVISGFATRDHSWLGAAVWGAIWVLYLSFVNVGQVFYGFGWESILLEAGFFAMFLGSDRVVPQAIPMGLLRWLEFRIMFGAGLIKLRGDACWKDLSCLNYHYETQPMPNPVSWYLHWAPQWTHQAGVLFNHFSELVVPFGYFLPQPFASIAGAITILFQGSIIISGNLSWLNLLTMVLALPMIAIPESAQRSLLQPELLYKSLVASVGILMTILSVRPVLNMISPGQVMNTSYNPFHLAGTYGAFGSVTKERFEVVIEGSDGSNWREYEFKGKPGDVMRRPAQIAPYHLRLDWLMWFAAMGDHDQQPWFVPLVIKLLRNDAETLSLMAGNPFPEHPPKLIRAQLYRYRFASPEEHRKTGAWWQREPAGIWFPPVSLKQ